jgi:hypothetical protein
MVSFFIVYFELTESLIFIAAQENNSEFQTTRLVVLTW